MKTKPPPDRRKFAGARDEMEYLYHKLLYWLYQRPDAARARPYADRLDRLLSQADANQDSIFGQECRSLVHESRGELAGATQYREKEIQLLRRLHEISGDSAERDIILKNYGYDDLSGRLDLLARLYHLTGQLDRAIATLKESKRVCAEHKVSFDGADMLAEYQEESKAATNGRASGKKRFQHLAR